LGHLGRRGAAWNGVDRVNAHPSSWIDGLLLIVAVLGSALVLIEVLYAW
jgi:hypothetical protein